MRPLTFSDDQGNEQKWLPGGPGTDPDAIRDFMDQRRGDGSTSVRIEDAENEEALVLLFDDGAVCRVKGAQDPRTEYRLVTNDSGYRNQIANFVRGGFSALDLYGPWLPDTAALARARLEAAFDGSVLRRTHPRELRRRLEVLTRVDGREPVTAGEVTHLGFGNGNGNGNGNGDTVNAWLAADGRALVVTFDRTSALNPLDDGGAHVAALYDGVPADLLAWVRDVEALLPASVRELPYPWAEGFIWLDTEPDQRHLSYAAQVVSACEPLRRSDTPEPQSDGERGERRRRAAVAGGPRGAAAAGAVRAPRDTGANGTGRGGVPVPRGAGRAGRAGGGGGGGVRGAVGGVDRNLDRSGSRGVAAARSAFMTQLTLLMGWAVLRS